MGFRHLFHKKEHLDGMFVDAFDAYGDAIFRFCYTRVRSRADALDITQEAFIRTWEYLREGKNITNLRAFLYKVARNLIIDESRKKRSISLDAEKEKGIEPMADDRKSIEARIDFKRTISYLDKLGEAHREVLTLRFVDGFSPKEIAELLQESENAIYVRIHRGLRELRAILHEK